MDTRDIEIKYLREQLKIKEDYIKALEYAFASIKEEILGWINPLIKTKDNVNGGDDNVSSSKHGVSRNNNTILS